MEENTNNPGPEKRFSWIWKGAAMGIAEVIPGVSGGTIAFISGIYERLLNAIKHFDLTFIRALLSGKLKAAFNHVDGGFLIFLVGGMVLGIVCGVFGISHLLENYPEILYAFFFGLIIASAWYIAIQVKKWNPATVIALLVGGGVAFLITQVSPAQGSTQPLFILISGFLAVSALMLPGISGSFILLLMGMYTLVIGTVKAILGGDLSGWWIVLCFASGMLLGLIIFSRVLTWMFRTYQQQTLALLAGFMLGSLPKIWPWRIPRLWMNEEGQLISQGVPGEHARILSENMVLPGAYHSEPYTVAAIICALIGIAIIALVLRMERRHAAGNIQSA